MDATSLWNPLLIGKLTRKEAEDNKAVYTRNGENKELREYVKKKFNVDTDDFHFEEQGTSIIAVISNKNEVVHKLF